MKRPSSRLLIIDEEGRLLLFWFRYEDRSFWATPGGALEPGETFKQAAARELYEEAGLTEDVGDEVWRCNTRFTGPDDVPIEAEEAYFLVRTRPEDVDFSHWTPDETQMIQKTAWLSRDEITTLEDPVFPENISHVLAEALDKS